MIRLGTLRDAGKRSGEECWIIVRSLKSCPKGTLHVPRLSPAPDLFHDYLDAARKGLYGPAWFREEYVPRFVDQMARDMEARTLLDRLYREGRSKDFLLACFCTDEATCHRSVIGGLLLGAGAAISCNEEYRRYFTMFREALSKVQASRKKPKRNKPWEVTG